MKVRKIIASLSDTVCVALFVYLLAFPQYATAQTRTALEFCGRTLIPSLFVYTVLTKTIICVPLTDKIAKITGFSGLSLILGILCGAPIGAKTALTLYESGRIDKKYAEYLCSFTNNASASFVIGFVGTELFADISVGLRLLVYQFISVIVTAITMRFVIYGRAKPPRAERSIKAKASLRDAITDAALTMINICACAVFFITAGGAISRIFGLPPIANAILKSLLEFSSGCAATASIGKYALPVTAFSIGFSGLSVALQVKSVLSGRLSAKPYLLGKLISCSVMTLLAVIFG